MQAESLGMLKQRVPLWSLFLVIGLISGFAFASRNSGGTYSLPAGNPVISGTTITSTWANTTLTDLGTEVTNSLDRQGRGGMAAPLKIVNGTVSAPGLTSASETSSGLFRNASGDWRFSVLGTAVLKLQSALVTTLVPLTVTGRTTTTDLTVSGTSTALSIVSASGDALTAQAAATNGTGVMGRGVGTGSGGIFYNSAVPAAGAAGAALNGISLNAGGIGVWGVGTGAYEGLKGEGGATGPGLKASAGTAATAAVSQDAIVVTNGYISMNGVTSPLTATNTQNRYTPKNITQAWAAVGIDNGGTFFVNDSYGMVAPIETNLASCTAYAIEMTLNAAFPNALSGQPAYAAVVGDRAPPPGAGSNLCRPVVVSKASSVVKVQFIDIAGNVCSKCGVGTQVNNTGFDILITGAY